ncbi:MAG: hypothetical protein WBI82_00335 [Sphaerochaeta sp.]
MRSTAYSSTSGSLSTSQYAAKMYADYRGGGNADWFFPSRDELNQMHQKLFWNNLGSFFGDYYYWSSSEFNFYGAWNQGFHSGGLYGQYRHFGLRVRPVRAF